MSNERVTENIVRDKLKEFGYYSVHNRTSVEEQKSEIARVKQCLKHASKTGKGGPGAPEFIISNSEYSDFLIIIECKGDVRNHSSQDGTNQSEFAVDGALHYAKYLAKDYNVVSVGVSGQNKSQLRVSTYLHARGQSSPKRLDTKGGARISDIISWEDYIEHATFDPTLQRLRYDELMSFSRDLHNFMREHAKLTESEKPLLVSGTLIALKNPAFSKSFDAYTPEDLQSQWLKVIKDEIDKADLPQAKKNNMTQPYSTIAVHPELGKSTKKFPKGPLFELIDALNKKVWPFISVYHDFDVVGQFYGEFLKYTGGDKKALGIVLTPRHVTDLFARIANVNKSTKVLDTCAGTGGFLVASMYHMMRDAITSQEKANITDNGLVGVENQPNMYALAASNMILRGDGKANLYQGSCFDDAIFNAVKKHECDVGMLNPPYSQSDEDLHELVFVKQMLDALQKNGIGIAIVPMSCAISRHPKKQELMNCHTLEGVMSMPQELFYPVGTVTCIMVWRAQLPHEVSDRKTWFGYWRDDGFVKTKHKGRIDPNDRWPDVRDRWVQRYRNREVHAGESVLQRVSAHDEWCAEAYMETDYSTIAKHDFEKVVKNYAIYRLLANDIGSDEEVDPDDPDQ